MKSRPKVLVEASAAFGEQTGVGTYVRELLGPLSRRCELTVFLASLKGKTPEWLNALQAKLLRSRWPSRGLLLSWSALRYPRPDSCAPKTQLLHSLNYSVVPTRNPLIVTLHDLYFLRVRGAGSRWGGQFFAKDLRRHASRVQHFIAVSELTRQDAIELLGIPPEKITVIWEAPRTDFEPLPPDKAHQLRQNLGLPRDYLLYFGSDDPRKNREGLQRAHLRLKGGPPLVLVGGQPPKPTPHLVWKPYLPALQMRAVLQGALALVYPSHYEGFGLPAIEAFAAGIPVAATPTGVLPQFEGCFLPLQPSSPEAMAETLHALSTDLSLRQNLCAHASQKVTALSWERAAHETEQVYRAVLGA